MPDYAEFRMVVSPDLANQGQWTTEIVKCPVVGLAGPQGTVMPMVTQAQLATLRSRNGWPNPQVLEQIGTSVWQSVMNPTVQAAFFSSLQKSVNEGTKLRLVIVLQGQENVANPAAILLSELPVESLYHPLEHFIATSLTTPVSRSFKQDPDRPALKIGLPLRVLVAVACPSDKPLANIAQEVQVINQAVGHLGHVLDIEVLQQATRDELRKRLRSKPYHVLHFIGHGGFDVVGDVEVPRAHLCFIRPDSTDSDPTDADTLSVLLRNSGVRLVVMTACSSAAPVPPGAGQLDTGPLGTRAFDGMAQRLVAGVSGVTATVAMQFDLEGVAAVEFTRAFYDSLLVPGRPIDEVVTIARQALIAQLQAGHRAWITPAVYSRCVDGKVFDIDLSIQNPDPQALSEIVGIDASVGALRNVLERMAPQPGDQGGRIDSLRTDWIVKINSQLARKAELLKNAVRVDGVGVAPGQEVLCRLSLRISQQGVIGPVAFRLEYPADKLAFLHSEGGADVAGPPPAADQGGGAILVALVAPSGGAPWQPREYELGFIRFAVVPGVAPTVLDLRVTGLQVTRDGQPVAASSIDGMLFVMS